MKPRPNLTSVRRYSLLAAALGLFVYSVIDMAGDVVRNAETAEGRKLFVRKDSGHYHQLAVRLAEQDEPIKYQMIKSHRQILYPAFLAVAILLDEDDPVPLGFVNVLFTASSILMVVLISWHVFESPVAGLLGGVILRKCKFLDVNTTSRLLTEPMYVFMSLVTIYFFLQYLKGRSPRYLYSATLFGGLAYLTRPNGLFLTASLLSIVALYDILLRSEQSLSQRIKSLLPRLVVAVGLFVLVTSPSWVPRIEHYGNPVYHGCLPNFLWVDTYAEAHTYLPKFTFSDYASSHTFGDAAKRTLHGLKWVYGSVPARAFSMTLNLLMLAGISLLFFSRRRSMMMALLLFMCMQLSPIVWTWMSNPTSRIAATAMLPFAIVFVTFAISQAIGICQRVGSRYSVSCRSPVEYA